jgi:hypothetical protein
VRNGARSRGITTKIMITPDSIIWIASSRVISLVKGNNSPYPTVVMDSTTNRSDSDQDRGLFSRSG